MPNAECKNLAAALQFQTLSGTLTVTKQHYNDKQLLQMSLPLSAAVDQLPAALLQQGNTSNSSSSGQQQDMKQLLQDNTGLVKLLTACLQGHPAVQAASAGAADAPAAAMEQLPFAVEYVGYCAAVKYLLVVLKAGIGRQGLEQLRPDYSGMAATVGGDEMIGVIVTIAADPGEAMVYVSERYI